jgi:Protein of unknown function (DUF1501)
MRTFRCAGPKLHRREMLRLGAATALGLTLPQIIQADSTKSHADHCILIFLNGGPSHLDMWDLKPEAPAEIRGEFRPIPTTVPGIQFGEHLPKMAHLDAPLGTDSLGSP